MSDGAPTVAEQIAWFAASAAVPDDVACSVVDRILDTVGLMAAATRVGTGTEVG